ncbi:MAG TPA: methyltransferase domain-containing protein [Longimicrobiales bacterium]|nr:methyltransferase domain-containing protein [Longimicrobiales bacterium]
MTHAWTERDVEALLRASGYSEEWHVRRIVRSALALPPASDGERLVDLGTHPAVLNVLAQVAGFGRAEGVDRVDTRADSWTVDMPVWSSSSRRTYVIHNRDLERDRLPFEDASVQRVTCLETLEHLLDPMHLLIEVNRILEPGGFLLLTTPNAVSWRSMVRAARRGHPFVYPLLVPGLTTNRHNIEYTPDQVRTLLAAAGFEGVVGTRSWWYRVGLLRKASLVLAGFRPRDRGDIVVALVRKRRGPAVRFPPELYQLCEEHVARNRDTTLSYRRA